MHFFETFFEQLGNINYLGLGPVVLLLILLALAFDFLNGLHDAANSIATIVSTRVLSPQMAVLWAAFFNFIAFMLFHLKVANTIGTGIIDKNIVTNGVIAGALIGACAWNILTWYWGLPTSSSHALIGGLVGAGLAQAGWSSLVWYGLVRTCLFILLAPLLGLVCGLVIAVAVHWIFCKARPRSVDSLFRRGQLLSAALYSLGHGGNDAQKTMGIIFVLLIAASAHTPQAFTPQIVAGVEQRAPTTVPTEMVLACHLAMGIGTLMGGWRIVKTMGQRISRLRPVDGFCAEGGAALTLMMTIFGGIPVSTTHTITGAIVGVGSLKRLSAVRWVVAKRVVWAWVFTIPGAAIVSGLSVLAINTFASWVAYP